MFQDSHTTFAYRFYNGIIGVDPEGELGRFTYRVEIVGDRDRLIYEAICSDLRNRDSITDSGEFLTFTQRTVNKCMMLGIFAFSVVVLPIT